MHLLDTLLFFQCMKLGAVESVAWQSDLNSQPCQSQVEEAV